MRVLLISNMYPSPNEPAYGPFIRDQVLHLRELGVAVDLVVNTNPRKGTSQLISKYARITSRALRRASRHRYDIVHAHYLLPPGLIGSAVARVRGTPLVVTCHGSDVPLGDRTWWLRAAARAALRSADAVIAVSEEAKRGLASRYGLRGDAVEVIDMGVDASRFSPDPEAREALRRRVASGDEPIVIAVAHLVPRKNLATAIDAVALLERGRLVIGGDGPERARLEGRAAELGVGDRITFLGAVRPEEVPGLLAGADAFVLPSRYEGRPIALLEAMAAGLPVVASAVGGTPEIVHDGVNGLLVDPEDVAGVSQALARALGGEGRSLGVAARATAVAHDVRESARRVARIYESVARRRQSARRAPPRAD